MKNFTLLLLSILFFAACGDDDNRSENYLIFGHSFGHCVGEECVEFFKVTESELREYEDNCRPGILSSCIPDSHQLSNAKFEQAKHLINAIPAELFEETESTFGCPDCADQGALYIEIWNEDGVRFWNLDHQNSGLPTYLHDYADDLKATIDLIND